ncbi:hypothetical protein BLNAU_9190 [Blattamonas nauphoetae]|uniref:Uncharacterized protein n=1 Tax=Blattamonas nauphoetae TaxID=2049346 RepID=A0ABQ9XWI5_9EUKA|nr:hypothetical protein BLNAU_9190 [Blattamonas nauphoetae]
MTSFLYVSKYEDPDLSFLGHNGSDKPAEIDFDVIFSDLVEQRIQKQRHIRLISEYEASPSLSPDLVLIDKTLKQLSNALNTITLPKVNPLPY